MRRRGISLALLMVLALVPLAIILNVVLLVVSFPDAFELVLVIDVPVFAAVGAVAFLSFRRQRGSAKPIGAPSPTPERIISNAVNHRDPKPPRTNSNLPESKEEAEAAEVFLGGEDVEQSARSVDQILARMKAKEDENLGVRPVSGLEEPRMHQATARALGEEPVEEMEKQPGEAEAKGYSLTPDKLKTPAFICRCGHTHRFLCLQCGLNVETAVKKKKMHWVEWTPEMVEMP